MPRSWSVRKPKFMWSLRSLQFLPIVLTVVPLFAILCLDARRQFSREAEEVESRARRVVAFVAVDASQILEATQQYLDALGSVWSAGESQHDDASHRDLLRGLASRVPHYASRVETFRARRASSVAALTSTR